MSRREELRCAADDFRDQAKELRDKAAKTDELVAQIERNIAALDKPEFSDDHLCKAADMGCLFDYSNNMETWHGPSKLLHIDTNGEYVAGQNGEVYKFIRPHRAINRVQMHDRSNERPWHVGHSDKVHCFVSGKWDDRAYEGGCGSWALVEFYIVLSGGEK